MLVYVDIINYANIINQIGYEKRGRLFGILTTKIKETLQSWELCCSHNEKDFILLCAYDEDHSVLKRRFLGCYQAVVKEWKADEELALVLPKFRAGIYRILKQDSDVNIMIEHAKFAKDYIKQFGSYGFSFFDNQCYERERRRLDIENRMEQALANGEFKLYVQPKVDTKTGIISGGEALIRWQEKNGTIVSPGEFILIFEENGFVKDLDYFVYNQMFEHLKYWIDVHGTDLIIAVNVSRIHLEEGEFIANLVNIARKHKIPVNQIELEITESAFLEDTDHLKEVLSNLHDIGFHISLDDFGAGYSSLNILKNLTIDILKLDRGFFLNPVPLHKDIVLITSIIDLAHKLGLKVVAEGIETEEYVKLLQKCGCDFIQGYYYYKPMPVEEFEKIAFYDE